jgi:hypothetical protein
VRALESSQAEQVAQDSIYSGQSLSVLHGLHSHTHIVHSLLSSGTSKVPEHFSERQYALLMECTGVSFIDLRKMTIVLEVQFLQYCQRAICENNVDTKSVR